MVPYLEYSIAIASAASNILQDDISNHFGPYVACRLMGYSKLHIAGLKTLLLMTGGTCVIPVRETVAGILSPAVSGLIPMHPITPRCYDARTRAL